MAYLFGREGLQAGGTCSASERSTNCIARYAGVDRTNGLVQTCKTTVDLRTIPAWKPSPDSPQKQQLAKALRSEIELRWQGAEEIVIRDFNLRDPQITICIKMPDGDYFQGCSLYITHVPHCEHWHSFGQAPTSDLRKWIFDRPYRLK